MRTFRYLKGLTVAELSEEYKKIRPELWKPSMVKMDQGDLIELIQDAESEDEAKSPKPVETVNTPAEPAAVEAPVIVVKKDLTISEMAEQIRKDRAQKRLEKGKN